MMNAIETKGLTKKFGVYKAVDNLKLQVPSGSIYLMGEERRFGFSNNTHIGYLPDVPNFYGYMTASEYLEFCGRLYNMETAKRKSRITGFSRGMKQRLGIAQALINEPDISDTKK